MIRTASQIITRSRKTFIEDMLGVAALTVMTVGLLYLPAFG